MTDYSDLIKRLRKQENSLLDRRILSHTGLYEKAADAIAAQQQEIERLREALPFDGRYPSVFKGSTKASVAHYIGKDTITIGIHLEGAQWAQAELPYEEAEQMAAHIKAKIDSARAALKEKDNG